MSEGDDGVWWRHRWLEAIYASDLKPMERFVATIYADHARDQRIAWVSLDVLVEKSGLGRTQAKKWRGSLVDQGWLVEIEAARQHRATRYVLSVPRGSANRPSEATPGGRRTDRLTGSRGSANRPSENPRGSDLEPQGVGFEGPGGRLADPDQSSDQSNHQSSSSSPAQKLLARLLGWGEEDERLDLLDDFLTANDVRFAQKWLTTCHENGDLERNFTDFIKSRAAAAATEDVWAEARRSRPTTEEYLRGLHELVGPEEAEDYLDQEAEAMGIDRDSWMVAQSAWHTANHRQQMGFTTAKEAS